MVKKYQNDAVLFVHENTQEIYKHCVKANLVVWSVAKKYQVLLYHKTCQNLTGIDTYEKIRLILACIYHDYRKISSKEQ